MSEDSPEEKNRRFLDLVHQASIRLAARGQRFALVDATKRATPGTPEIGPTFRRTLSESEDDTAKVNRSIPMQETGSPGDRSNLTNVSRAALFERLFKLGVLVILLAVLAVAWGMRDNGRYISLLPSHAAILDTRTGTIYDMSEGAVSPIENAFSVEKHPQTGILIVHYAQWTR